MKEELKEELSGIKIGQCFINCLVYTKKETIEFWRYTVEAFSCLLQFAKYAFCSLLNMLSIINHIIMIAIYPVVYLIGKYIILPIYYYRKSNVRVLDRKAKT